MSIHVLPTSCWLLSDLPESCQLGDGTPHYLTRAEAEDVVADLVQARIDDLFALLTAPLAGQAVTVDGAGLDVLTDRARQELHRVQRLVPVRLPYRCAIVECDHCGRLLTPEQDGGGQLHLAPAQRWAPTDAGWSSDGQRDHCPDCPPLTDPDDPAVPGVGQLTLPVDLPCGGGPGGEGRC